jgi:hypothetical protein
VAGKSSSAIEVIDMSQLCLVTGGSDKQTEAVKAEIAKATAAMEDVAKAVIPKNFGMTNMLMQVLGNRGRGSGPSSAPALPPTSTLTR